MPSPFVIHTGDLFRHHGVRRAVTRRGRLAGVALSSAHLTGDDVVVEATLEAQGATITLTGTVTGRWAGECRRCLEVTGGEVVAELSEVFEPDPVEGETYPLARDHLDLEPVIREALALALPLAPLCDEACGGPDPGGHSLEIEDDDVPEPRDLRWAALDELRFDG